MRQQELCVIASSNALGVLEWTWKPLKNVANSREVERGWISAPRFTAIDVDLSLLLGITVAYLVRSPHAMPYFLIVQ
jgi:hypothetical protein